MRKEAPGKAWHPIEGLECVRGAHTIEGVLEYETLQGLHREVTAKRSRRA